MEAYHKTKETTQSVRKADRQTRTDRQAEKASRRKLQHWSFQIGQYVIILLLIGGHLWFAFKGADLIVTDEYKNYKKELEQLSIAGQPFFQKLFIVGFFLYALLLCLNLFGLRLSSPLKTTAGAATLSLAISVLLSANHSTLSHKGAVVATDLPTGQMTIWGLIHELIAERQTLLIFIGLAAVITISSIYYVIRSFLTIEYSGGSGIQIRLPGQTVYYLPVFPQVSWQNTKIAMEAGERYDVELYGYVSPGASDFDRLSKYNERFVERQKHYKKAGKRPDFSEKQQQEELPIWPYGLPSGYDKSFYNSRKPNILKSHPIWQEDDYYKKDDYLTIKGQPHNKVFGNIKSDSDDEPRDAIAQSAYDWQNKDHREELICLSSDNYPITIEAKRTGKLWVVINDDDEARWDNSGMFFLKITHRARILSKR